MSSRLPGTPVAFKRAMKLFVLASLCLTACIAPTEPTPWDPPPADLASFDGVVRIEQQSKEDGVAAVIVRLRRTTDCVVLAPGATATLDGVPAAIHPGGYDEGDAHGDSAECYGPRVEWPVFATGDAATIAITDGVTTYRIVLDRPFEKRSFSVADPILSSGDRVTVQSTHPGIFTHATVRVHSATTSTSFNATTGLELGADYLRFTQPPVEAETPATISVDATYSIGILACDAPGGCNAVLHVVAKLPVTLAP